MWNKHEYDTHLSNIDLFRYALYSGIRCDDAGALLSF
jgi:hypothetical protein